MTWSGTISPVLAGSLLAAKEEVFRYELMVLLLIAALFVQSGVNMFNDYFDFQNGQDKERWCKAQTASLSNYPFHHHVPYVATGLIATAALLGLWLAVLVGWWVAFVGLFGITAGIAYSAGRHSLASHGLGEATAALFLGIATTLLGYSVQTQRINLPVIFVGLIFALLISSMVLTNNIRDIEKDVGFRRTLAMRLGRRNAIWLLKLLLGGAYVGAIILAGTAVVPMEVLVVLAALPIAIRIPRSFHGKRQEEQLVMKQAAWHHWAFGLLFGMGVFMGVW
ncbi:prenyltransferase [Halobacillus sp. MO56]